MTNRMKLELNLTGTCFCPSKLNFNKNNGNVLNIWEITVKFVQKI